MFIALAHTHGRRRGRALLMTLMTTALLLALAAPPRAAAQVGGTDASGTGGSHTIQGRLVGPSGRRPEMRFKVILEGSGFGSTYVFSDVNGTFRFTSLRSGNYTIVVEGGDEFETAREHVLLETTTIRTNRGIVGTPISRPVTLQIYLRPKRADSSGGLAQPGVLNASLAGVPKPAADLYNKALEASRAKETERAVDLLKAAVEAHPQFRLALSELGTQYLRLKRPEKAAEALRAALKLAPDDQPTLVNYGIALYDLKEFAESEAQFRKAVQKQSAAPVPRLYLGLILLKRRELEEAEKELRAAIASGGEAVAVAHYYLGGIYWGRHDYKRAADELEIYLRLAPNTPDAARVRTTIQELRAKK
jgi:Tfp pilus assembly protein PilF